MEDERLYRSSYYLRRRKLTPKYVEVSDKQRMAFFWLLIEYAAYEGEPGCACFDALEDILTDCHAEREGWMRGNYDREYFTWEEQQTNFGITAECPGYEDFLVEVDTWLPWSMLTGETEE